MFDSQSFITNLVTEQHMCMFPPGIKHRRVVCNICGLQLMMGMRWNCINCYDYDLCTFCYMSGEHELDHEFNRMDTSRYVEVTLRLLFLWVLTLILFCGLVHSGTSELRTPRDHVEVSTIRRCPLYREYTRCHRKFGR